MVTMPGSGWVFFFHTGPGLCTARNNEEENRKMCVTFNQSVLISGTN